MAKNDKSAQNNISHMPENSTLFEKIIPASLIFMGIVMVGLILFSFAIIFGWIAF